MKLLPILTLAGCSFLVPEPRTLPIAGPAQQLTIKFAPDGPTPGALYVCSPRENVLYCVEYGEFLKDVT